MSNRSSSDSDSSSESDVEAAVAPGSSLLKNLEYDKELALVSFDIQPMDTDGYPFASVVDLQVVVMAGKKRLTPMADEEVSVNGQMHVAFTPILGRKHTLDVTVNGLHIKDSPFTLLPNDAALFGEDAKEESNEPEETDSDSSSEEEAPPTMSATASHLKDVRYSSNPSLITFIVQAMGTDGYPFSDPCDVAVSVDSNGAEITPSGIVSFLASFPSLPPLPRGLLLLLLFSCVLSWDPSFSLPSHLINIMVSSFVFLQWNQGRMGSTW